MIHLTCRRSYQLYRSWLWGMNFLDTSDVLKKLSVVSKLIVRCRLCDTSDVQKKLSVVSKLTVGYEFFLIHLTCRRSYQLYRS